MAFAIAVMKKFGDDQAGNQVALLTYFAFVATFPLLLALTTILGVALRDNPELQRDLVNSAFAEFPIIGAQIHDQLGVATSGNTFSLTVGVVGALSAAVGFANALQDTLSSLWSVPKLDRPGFPTRYLRGAGLLLLLAVGAAVTARVDRWVPDFPATQRRCPRSQQDLSDVVPSDVAGGPDVLETRVTQLRV